VSAAGSKLGLVLSKQGNILFNDSLPITKDGAQLGRCLPFVDAMVRARKVANVLDLAIKMPEKWQPADFDDLEELHSLIETGSYTFPDAYDFSCTIDAEASKIPSLGTGEEGVLMLTSEMGGYDFLGERLVMPQFSRRFTKWKEASVAAAPPENGNARQLLTLIGATLTHTWPRFVKTVAPTE
jgi:hypothetical protein